jgi:hypothetical protein
MQRGSSSATPSHAKEARPASNSRPSVLGCIGNYLPDKPGGRSFRANLPARQLCGGRVLGYAGPVRGMDAVAVSLPVSHSLADEALLRLFWLASGRPCATLHTTTSMSQGE